jgi:peptidoglycan/LPS O-acetylase OafA/YrhL
MAALRWLGNMSYSYYLLHGITLTAVALLATRVLPPAPGRALVFVGLLPAALLATFLSSTGLFLLVERPLSLTPAGTRKPRPAPVAAVAAETAAAE